MKSIEPNNKQLRILRSRAHSLKPVVWIGQQGISDNVLKELDIALEHHELIKIKLGAGDKAVRATMVSTLLEHSKASLVQQIGAVAVLFKRNLDKPVIQFE